MTGVSVRYIPFALSGGAAADAAPGARETPGLGSGRTEGCRIGIDLGGSDRKAAAVIDGETVYTEEVVWQPKTASDLRYHYEGSPLPCVRPRPICREWTA